MNSVGKIRYQIYSILIISQVYIKGVEFPCNKYRKIFYRSDSLVRYIIIRILGDHLY